MMWIDALPLLCSSRVLADVLGLNEREFGRLARAGIIKKQAPGLYDLKQSIQAVILAYRMAYRRKMLYQTPTPPGNGRIFAAWASALADKLRV
jgi:hypothetical protein